MSEMKDRESQNFTDGNDWLDDRRDALGDDYRDLPRPGLSPEDPERQSVKTSRLILGLTLIAIGLAYILDRLGYLDASDLWQWWPIALVAAGLGKLFSPGSGSSRITGGLITLVGVWLLLGNLDIMYVSFWDWWPLVLVAIGLRLILSPGPKVESSNVDTVNSFAMLGGTSRNNCSSEFIGGDLVAFMGGCDIDLRNAQITGKPAVIDAFAFWGGIDIKVPESWKVEVNGVPLLGGFEDSTNYRPDSDGPFQQLIIKGFAIMGGVEVRN